MSQWRVLPLESGQKLLVFLKSKSPLSVSARHLKRAIDAGKCRINDRIERFASYLVGQGDCISFDDGDSQPKEIILPLYAKERILYIDKDLIAYHKPAGIASQDQKLLSTVQELAPNANLLHRLDKDTTGVLLFARTPMAQEFMLNQFKQHKMIKTYYAIVDGIPQLPIGLIENHLGKLSVYQGQTIWGAVAQSKGLFASTRWRIDKKYKDAALLVCMPETGRTHQIRVHLAGIGHPILGDIQYGRQQRNPYHPPRMMLHAFSLAFTHPALNSSLNIEAPLPSDFKAAIQAVK